VTLSGDQLRWRRILDLVDERVPGGHGKLATHDRSFRSQRQVIVPVKDNSAQMILSFAAAFGPALQASLRIVAMSENEPCIAEAWKSSASPETGIVNWSPSLTCPC
jgi:hypothetical protein